MLKMLYEMRRAAQMKMKSCRAVEAVVAMGGGAKQGVQGALSRVCEHE